MAQISVSETIRQTVCKCATNAQLFLQVAEFWPAVLSWLVALAGELGKQQHRDLEISREHLQSPGVRPNGDARKGDTRGTD